MTQRSLFLGVPGGAGAYDTIAFEAVRQRVEAAVAVLRVARGLAESQRRIDLTGLESDIGRLCAAALDLDPAQGRVVRDSLRRVLDELDALAAAVEPP